MDFFEKFKAGLTAPGSAGFDVTPDDANDMDISTRGVYVGTSGDLKYTTITGITLTKKNLVAGMTHPMRVRRIWATGTTATDIIGEY